MTPKSSPSCLVMAGIAHRPHQCIAAAPWTMALGSYQSVVKPCNRAPDWCSWCRPATAWAACGVANAAWVPLTSSAPLDHSSR